MRTPHVRSVAREFICCWAQIVFPIPTWAQRRCVNIEKLWAASRSAAKGEQQCSGHGACSEDGACTCRTEYKGKHCEESKASTCRQYCAVSYEDKDCDEFTPCTKCGAGKYSTGGHAAPATVCRACPTGNYAPAGSLPSQCQACPVGKADRDDNSWTPCTVCGPGTITAVVTGPGASRLVLENATVCSFCPAGTTDLDKDPTTACVQNLMRDSHLYQLQCALSAADAGCATAQAFQLSFSAIAHPHMAGARTVQRANPRVPWVPLSRAATVQRANGRMQTPLSCVRGVQPRRTGNATRLRVSTTVSTKL